MKELTYHVTSDFRPWRQWTIKAGSESEARMELVRLVGVPYNETSADLAQPE